MAIKLLPTGWTMAPNDQPWTPSSPEVNVTTQLTVPSASLLGGASTVLVAGVIFIVKSLGSAAPARDATHSAANATKAICLIVSLLCMSPRNRISKSVPKPKP